MGVYHYLIYTKLDVDVCGAEVRFNFFSGTEEGLFCDSFQSKSVPKNATINNNECTKFLMWLPCYCISCINKPTEKSQYILTLKVVLDIKL